MESKEDISVIDDAIKRLPDIYMEGNSIYQFIDVDCDYVSAPLANILVLFKESLYNQLLSSVRVHLVEGLKSMKIRRMSSESLIIRAAHCNALV